MGTETSSCDGFDKHLAGHCKNVGGSVKKTFTGLGRHSALRLQAQYHFLDSWDNERAWAKINGKTVWTDLNDIRGLHPNALNLCGGESPEGKFAVPIDVVIPHVDGIVEVGSARTWMSTSAMSRLAWMTCPSPSVEEMNHS